jgi:hypothetical protein
MDKTMTENKPGKRQPDAALKALDRLVGTWKISGDATGISTFRWMEGGFFLIHEGEIKMGDTRYKVLEVIGRERPVGAKEASPDIKARTFTSEGDTNYYVWELEGDTFTNWLGEKGSSTYYKGTFSADGNTLTGEWVWPGGGYQATMTRIA